VETNLAGARSVLGGLRSDLIISTRNATDTRYFNPADDPESEPISALRLVTRLKTFSAGTISFAKADRNQE